jgi:hypothetical protein
VKIDFRVIAHKRQRYETVGDWYRAGGAMQFRASRMSDRRYAVLVFVHELVEWLLCREAGVKARDVDRFDMAYETARERPVHFCAPCGCDFYEEPGDDPHAPYHAQHVVASAVERTVAKAMGVDWDKYNDEVESL